MIEYHQERWIDMQYDKEFKLQALGLTDEIRVKAAEDSCQNCTTVPVNGYRNS